VGRVDPLDVGTRLVALAQAGAPLRRSLAAIAGRVVATRAWERLGFARLSDYARERVGLSARQIHDLAHVDAALAKLPRIEGSFAAGALTWTKARLLCRVATPEDEAVWIDAARRLTARALAREVRAVDARALETGGVETDEEGGIEQRCETLVLRLDPQARGKWSQARLFARFNSAESLEPWAVAEAVAAEVLSAIPLDDVAARALDALAHGCAAEGAPRDHPVLRAAHGCAGQGVEGTPGQAGTHPAPFLRSLVEGLGDADAFELDARLRRAVHLEQRLCAEMGPLLLALARRRGYRAYGCPSLDVFARECLGISPRKAQALLRLERACALSAALREAWRAGRLSWRQAHVLVPLLVLEESAPWHAAWVVRAQHVTVRRLEDDVDQAIVSGVLDPEAKDAAFPDPHTGAYPMASAGHPTPYYIYGCPRDAAHLFRAILATVQRRIERRSGRPASESEALCAMIDHALESWGAHRKIPPEHRVFARDGWRCTAPGCTSYRNLHDHHIRFRSAGGSDDLSNRTTLCAWHHLRGVHAGVVRVTGQAPHGLRFELGARRGKPPLASFRSGDVAC
jgi:hypothetical protein